MKNLETQENDKLTKRAFKKFSGVLEHPENLLVSVLSVVDPAKVKGYVLLLVYNKVFYSFNFESFSLSGVMEELNDTNYITGELGIY